MCGRWWPVFESDRSGKFKLWVMREDGRKLRQLTCGKGVDRFGVFCDQQTVVFQRTRGGTRISIGFASTVGA